MSGRILYVVSLLCALLVVRTCSQPTLRVTTQTLNPNVWVLECRSSSNQMATLILDRGRGLEEISLSGEHQLPVTPEDEVTASCRVGDEASVPIMLAAIQRYSSSLPQSRDQDVYLNQEVEIDCPFEFGRLSNRLEPYEIFWVRKRSSRTDIPVDEDPESEGFSLNGSTLILPITTSPKSYFCESNIQLCNDTFQCRSPDQQTGPIVNLNVLGFNLTAQPTLRVTIQTQKPNVWVLECRSSSNQMATLILDRGRGLEEISLTGEYPLPVTPEEEVTASCRVGDETSVPIMLAAIQRYNSSLSRSRDQDVYLNQEAEIDCPFEFGRLSKSLVPYEIFWVRKRSGRTDIRVDEDPESEGFSLNGSTLILPITTFSPKSYFCESRIQLCNDTSQCPSPDQETGPIVNLNVHVLGFIVTAQPQSQIVTLDEPATFNCSACGRGDFKIKWMYAGVEYEPEESDCEDGGVCVTSSNDSSGSLRQVDSTITIPSNLIVESEQVVQCRVTLGMSQTEMYNATLGCSHCVTTTTSTTTEDVDECTAGTHMCDDNAVCNNIIGNYTCDCRPGYDGNGFVCNSTIIHPAIIATVTTVSVFALIAISTIIIVIIVMCLNYHKKKRGTGTADQHLATVNVTEIYNHANNEQNRENMNEKGLELTTIVHSPDIIKDIHRELLIPTVNLRILESIGQGEFGIVYRGHLLKDLGQVVVGVVAIKTLKGFFHKDLVENLLKECTKMQQFDHPNILTLTGVCLDGGQIPFIVMPFMTNGSLLSYLQKERKNLFIPVNSVANSKENIQKNIALKQLMEMCFQVSKGMEYLARKRFIHRDLAARNCMIDMHFVIKVADFGLSEQLETKNYFRQDKGEAIKLPVKWLAPESLMDYVFSEKSDVWAYGVTCWEIFSGGKVPYVSLKPTELLTQLERGYRMEKPSNAACCDEIYDLVMLQCWKASPAERPAFSELVKSLSQSLESMAGYLHIGAFDHQEIQMTERLPSGSNVLQDSNQIPIHGYELATTM